MTIEPMTLIERLRNPQWDGEGQLNVEQTRASMEGAADAMGRLAEDNPELDATDGAHPAWWRGYDYGSSQWRMLAENTLTNVAGLLDDLAQGGAYSGGGYSGEIRKDISLLLKALNGIRIEKELAANGAYLKTRAVFSPTKCGG
jgi:hypothetical protein